MFKQQLLGRLGLFVSISVLVGACAVGEIGDAPGGARLGPGDDFVGQIDPSEPFAPGIPAALTCAGAGPDVSTSNDWRSSDASLPAFDALYFEFKARPTTANIDGLVGVGAEDINDFAAAALTVRFAEDGLVDVRDGAVYNSDTSYAYDPGVWYTVAVSADIATETYDVEIGPCGEPRETLIEGASFRQESDVSDQLSTWGVWSSQTAALEVSTPTWMASGGCASATCQSLGSECGEPSNGCGGTLNCGVCGAGQTCSSGVCVDEPVSVPPPPPSCTPATCQSLGNQCGVPSDGCGGTLNCGGCPSGQVCSSGLCVNASVPPPPCVPNTCQSLGIQCGVASNGCGGALNCDTGGETCDDRTPGEVCNGSGQCVAPSNWWDVVDQPDATNTGPNCSAPGCPSATLLTANAPPAVVTQNGAIYENFTTTAGGFYIDADNVTLRNFLINHSSGTAITVRNGSNLLMEYGEIVGSGGCGQHMDHDGYTARFMKMHSCDDVMKINAATPTSGPVVYENSYLYDVQGGHGDTVQIWPNGESSITFRHNYMVGGTNAVIFDTGLDSPAALLVEENWFIGNGGGYTIYCSDIGGATRTYQNNLFDRTYKYGPVTGATNCTWINNLYSDDFSLVPSD